MQKTSLQASNVENEVKRLKEKCNVLLTYIDTLKGQLAEAEARVSSLQNPAELITMAETVSAWNRLDADQLATALQMFYQSIQLLKEVDGFLNTGIGMFDRHYCSAEYRVVISILEQLYQKNSCSLDASHMIQLWASIGLLQRDNRGRITYKLQKDGKSIRTIRINEAVQQLCGVEGANQSA